MPIRIGADSAWRAFRSRNYRLFFVGQSLSLVGTWMQQVAMGWLVYRLTGSAAWLGMVTFAAQAPTFFVTPVAGVLADRWDRQRMFVVTQAGAMIQALTLSGQATIAWLLVLATWLGLINAIDAPVRQSFVPDLLGGPADLANAIAWNSTLINGARMVGPALAGFLIALIGEGGVFLLNGLSYVAVIAALLAIRVPRGGTGPGARGLLPEMLAGWRYVARSVPIRSILVFLAVIGVAAGPVSTLLPVVASDVLGGGPNTLGLLMAANGCGALAAALLLARRPSVVGLGRWIAGGAALLGVALMAFAASRSLPLSMGLLLLSGLGLMTEMAGSNPLIQAIVDPAMRGRVMSLYTLAILGSLPFGSLAAGTLAQAIGTPWTLALGGMICLSAAAVLGARLGRLREATRPVYRERGILPPEDRAV